MNNIQISDLNTNQEVLTNEELLYIQGGGLFGDIYDAINESWTDIKKGIVDGFNEN